MTVVQTVLVFIGIPLAIILFLTLCVYAPSLMTTRNRYRPGRAWDHDPAWFVPHPDAVVRSAAPSARALEAGTSSTTAVGGASGEW